MFSGNVTVEHGLMTFVIAPDEVKIGANIFIVRLNRRGLKKGLQIEILMSIE